MKKLILITITLLLVGILYAIPTPSQHNVWVFNTETGQTVLNLNDWTAPWWAFYNEEELFERIDKDDLDFFFKLSKKVLTEKDNLNSR